jgi:hypothetical protein
MTERATTDRATNVAGAGPPPRRHPKPIQRWIRHTWAFTAWRYAQSYVGNLRDGEAVRDATTFCLFLGHARSGHSIVGALLDAHPRIVLADEFDALEYVDARFSKGQILYLSYKIARDQARRQRVKRGRGGSTYSYFVPGQWQGATEGATVVGASHAGESVRRLASDPTLLGRFERRVQPMDVRFVHVVRNPFDNLATMMLRGGRSFDAAFEHYFSHWESLVRLRASLDPKRISWFGRRRRLRASANSWAFRRRRTTWRPARASCTPTPLGAVTPSHGRRSAGSRLTRRSARSSCSEATRWRTSPGSP